MLGGRLGICVVPTSGKIRGVADGGVGVLDGIGHSATDGSGGLLNTGAVDDIQRLMLSAEV